MLAPWLIQYIGIPFVDRGRDPATGLDCWGLAKLVLEKHFDLPPLPDFSDQYARTKDACVAGLFRAEMPRWQRVAEPRPGDVAVLRLSGQPRHVGVMVDHNVMLTTDRVSGSALERLDDPRWIGRLEGYYRHA